jgi:AcrR family transcriptional regulator
MSDPPRRRVRVLRGINPDQIITAALHLTRTGALERWTLRQLADALGAYPAVVYHHVGDREDIVAQVVDRVAVLIRDAVPAAPDDPALSWRPWLRQFAGNMRAILVQYPGVARRLAMSAADGDDGPAHALHQVITDVLHRGGFGDNSPTEARIFLITAISLVSVENDRQLHRQRHGDPSWLVWGESMLLYGEGVNVCLRGLAASITENTERADTYPSPEETLIAPVQRGSRGQ